MEFRCSTCQELKPTEAFSGSWLRRKTKVCRDCKAEYNRRWYDANREKQVRCVMRNNERYRRRIADLLLELKRGPCTDCGSIHPMAMEFDHVWGVKDTIIAYAARRHFSLQRLMAELAKCQLVCSNCHRVRTAGRIQAAGRSVYWGPKPTDDGGREGGSPARLPGTTP